MNGSQEVRSAGGRRPPAMHPETAEGAPPLARTRLLLLVLAAAIAAAGCEIGPRPFDVTCQALGCPGQPPPGPVPSPVPVKPTPAPKR